MINLLKTSFSAITARQKRYTTVVGIRHTAVLTASKFTGNANTKGFADVSVKLVGFLK